MFGLFKREKPAASDKISLSDDFIKYMERKRFYFVIVNADYKLRRGEGKYHNSLICLNGYNIQYDTEVVVLPTDEEIRNFDFRRNFGGEGMPRFRIDIEVPEIDAQAIADYLRAKPENEVVGATVSFTEKDGKFYYYGIELSSYLKTAPEDYMNEGSGPRAFRERLLKTHSW